MRNTSVKKYDQVFFPFMGLTFIGVALAGFWPSFVGPISQGRTDFPAAIVFHAIVMFGWLGVFVVQGLLPGAGKLQLHRRLGLASVGLFLALMVSAVTISIGSFVSDLPPDVRVLINNLFFLQLVAWVLSPVLFVLAIRARVNRTADHKRYMLLLTFFLIEAAASRIKWLPGMSSDEYWIVFQYLYLDIFLLALAIYDYKTLGQLAHATKVGLIIFLSYQALTLAIWDTDVWLGAAGVLLEFFS
ncbi:MAG: hypothetical protein AAF385_01485 [Pseudomonadota bacterium]